MGDRGNCKQFLPNIFNPSKCQNCFKTQEAHLVQQNSGNFDGPRVQSRLRGSSLITLRDRNATVKSPIKEGILVKGTADTGDANVQNWEEFWYVLYSTGELEAFEYKDGKANKEKSCGVILLQDFIRMLDGLAELGESNCVGFKALKGIVYFKAPTKVDFENWWKDFSTFVASPMKRSNTVTLPSTPGYHGAVSPTGKPWLGKTYSSPTNLALGKGTRPTAITSPNSDGEASQVQYLRNQLQKLEEENKRIPKLNEEKRKLELEVNYWKEYVTNTNSLKKSGGKIDFEQELTKAKTQVVELQDELNETQKKLKYTSGKLILQSKELADAKASVQEANHMISIHKASVGNLKSEIKMLRQSSNERLEEKPGSKSADISSPKPVEDSNTSVRTAITDYSDSHELEAKFVSLREKMKKIEKELFQKSKEVEKANESRAKVAKYTRSLLHDLETKLNNTQKKLAETEEKLTNTSQELEFERERRIRLESERDDFSRSRSSSMNSFTVNANDLTPTVSSPLPSPGEKSENDVSSKYADYYRSRYKETEAALFDKDKKLAETQGKFEELQTKYKSATNQFKSLDELQIKLSDATHKLSDRQLKIHELTREIENLRSFASGYERKSKELTLQNERVSALEQQIAELKQKVAQFESESEIFRIKETVMKEQITALETETTDESDDDESRLERQIEIKKKVDRNIELETTVRQLVQENRRLKEGSLKVSLGAIAEIATGVGKSTSLNDLSQLQNDRGPAKISELQRKNSQLEQEKEQLESSLLESRQDRTELEDKLLREISELKEKQAREMEEIKIASRQEISQYNKLKDEHSRLVKIEEENTVKTEQDKVCIIQLQNLVTQLKEEIKESKTVVSEQERALEERDKMIQDRDSLLREKDKSFEELTTRLSESIESKRFLEQQITDIGEKANHNAQDLVSSEKYVARLQKENQELREQFESISFRLDSENATKDISLHGQKDFSISDNIDGNIIDTSSDRVQALRNEIKELRQRNDNTKKRLEETSRELIRSEENVIQLSGELQGYFELEKKLTIWAEQVEGKLMRMQAQLIVSKDTMESKVEDLEHERNNVNHLVEVTSAYIKELESSLTEAKVKIEELQNAEKEAEKAQEQRMPPEGSSEKERDDNVSDDTSEDTLDEGESHLQKLAAKVMELEREAVSIRTAHTEEVQQLIANHEQELNQLKVSGIYMEANENTKEFQSKIEELECQLHEQEKKHNEEMKQLSDDYRAELKAAFSGETGNMDLLNRVQDLEVELEEARVRFEETRKQSEEKHKQEIEEMKDDLSKVLQASMSSLYQPYEGTVGQDNAQELEERIIGLETEMQELKVKHEGELQMEREAHQKEMEETIRDMLMVREAFDSGRYEGIQEDGGSSTPTAPKGYVTTEEFNDLTVEYEKKIQEKVEEHDKELEQVRQDMATVIEAMRQGGSSETILELSTHAQEVEKLLEETRVNFDLEKKDLLIKLEKSESANFFGLRRNEEMGTKIYQMQREMEEMEWKHKLELQAYKDAVSNGNESQSIKDLMRVNEEFGTRVHGLECELEKSNKKHIEEMEAYALKLQEEKRATISEMTDKVLRLESLIEETKEKYDADISEFELRSREERIETTKELKNRIQSLEIEQEECRKEYEEELACQVEEHEKEIAELKERHKLEMQEQKKAVLGSPVSSSELDSENKRLKRELKSMEDKHQEELEGLQEKFSKDLTLKQNEFDGQVTDIRTEYEERLKSCIKENMRRQSISERKTDSQRIRELNRKVEDLELTIERQKKEYETEVTNYKTMIEKQQALIAELRSSSPLFTSTEEDKTEKTQKATVTLGENDSSKQRVHELEEQIDRYEKRIEYYRDKAHRDKEDENQRVEELQAEVNGLRSAVRELTEKNPESYWGPKVPASETRTVLRRRSDNDERAHRPRDCWKRWSDVHERQEVIVSRINELDERKYPKLTQLKKEEVGKSGSVARRKALWENIKHDEPARRNTGSRPLSSVRP